MLVSAKSDISKYSLSASGDWKVISAAFASLQEEFSPESSVFNLSRLLIFQAINHFDGLTNLRNKRFLDLGCGCNDCSDGYSPHRDYEPWFCRLCFELGIDVLGIDIGSLDGEKFSYRQLDLSEEHALSFLADRSFDGILARSFLDSPALVRAVGHDPGRRGVAPTILQERIHAEIQRLAVPGGFLSVG